jgi:hypothetical protein
MSDTKTIPLTTDIGRDTDGIPCTCGGYAAQVAVTPEEEKAHGCGRPGCCARAFVCKLCKTRLVGSAEAPEME